ncbi:MAG TPA: plastocyanin/azurin family copper-binding protein [Candidatus Limnocylindrales bacterium]|jgi:plastocyanin|nr:plastocyanin/azurin family copper-binding protein [Candidatus Limnocylindrales bacterium]
MRSIHRTLTVLAVAVLVAACGGGGAATTAPTTAAGTAATGTAAAGTTGPAATQAAGICTDVTQAAPPTDVNTAVKDFTWEPVSAKVGQVITWKNNDSAPHGVQTDESGCKMNGSIGAGQTRSLVFNQAGTYTFFCFIHTSMKGTITIS